MTKPMLFLSYRREPSADLARYIRDRLTALGVDVFFDVENINGGRFAAIIEKEIINRQHFLVILTPKTLDSNWVRLEIETALKHRRNIIPLMAQGFSFSQPLPPEIKELADYSGIPYDYQDPDRAIQRIIKAIGISPTPTPPGILRRFWGIGGNPTLIGWITILAFVLAFAGITLNTLLPHSDVTTVTTNPATDVKLVVAALPTLPTTVSAVSINQLATVPPVTIDVPGTIVAATSLANVQATAAMSAVFGAFTQTAAAYTKTPIPAPLSPTQLPPTAIKTIPTITVAPATNAPVLVPTLMVTSTPQSIPANSSGFIPVTEIDPDTGYAYATIPGGVFSDTRGSANDSFQIGIFPVTNQDYLAFLNAHGNLSDQGETRLNYMFGGSRIHLVQGQWQLDSGYEKYPVIDVTLAGAQDFCRYFSARLPTSTEYHKAAAWNPSTQQMSIFPWGNGQPTSDLANYGSSHNGTTPVDSFPKGRSPVGAYDMTGNIREWTASAVGVNQIQLGGGWDDDARLLKLSVENLVSPSISDANIGFRCAR